MTNQFLVLRTNINFRIIMLTNVTSFFIVSICHIFFFVDHVNIWNILFRKVLIIFSSLINDWLLFNLLGYCYWSTLKFWPIPGTYSTYGRLWCHTVYVTGPRFTVSSIGSPHLVVTHKNTHQKQKQKTTTTKSKRANPGPHDIFGVFIWLT